MQRIEERLSALEILRGPERKQILEGWNRTDRPYGQSRTVVELFEEQVGQAGAVKQEGREIRCGELNRRANGWCGA